MSILSINITSYFRTDLEFSYIIDRYETLPDVTVFMHGGRYQWHNDNPLYGMCRYPSHLSPHNEIHEPLTLCRLRHLHQRPPTPLRPLNRLRQPPLLLRGSHRII
jgi:hypothetical protein